jgi:hypothetical protein
VLREDVEDQRRAVEDLDVELLLEVSLLRRCQLIVEDDGRVVELGALGDDLLHLPFADVGGRVAALHPLRRLPDDARAGGAREQSELFERALGVPAAADAVGAVTVAAPELELRGDEERALLGLGGLV